jgi:non-heme chloroperoxidase
MRSGHITTNDGVRLHYVEAGSGPDLLLVPAWTVTAEVWRHQIEEFSQTHHVIAYDPRGHGLSDSPSHGYRISRLAADARQLIEALHLTNVTWVGHSMGCGVAWAYWDLYGGEHLARLVLMEMPPALMSQSDWTPEMASEIGSIHSAVGLADFVSALRGPDAQAVTAGALDRMCSSSMPEKDRKFIYEQMMLMDRRAASTLMFEQCAQDWRDILQLINIPTLVIGGESSLFSVASMKNLGASILGSTVVIISAADRGSHFAFFENPSVVNSAIRDFLAAHE